MARSQPGPVWGAATYNAALMHAWLGQHRMARETALRVIASSVDDRDPGGNLMRTNQNYRHEAAGLIAASHRDQGAYPLAYYWSLKAAEEYPYRSWCGTCSDSAAAAASRTLAADAARMGPLGLMGHMIYRPNHTLLLWIPFGLIAGGWGAWNWRRSRKKTEGRL